MKKVKDTMLANQHVLNLAWLLSVPSWTGCHIKLRIGKSVNKDMVKCKDCLDKPATEIE